MIHIKNLYLHFETYNMGLKWSLYLTSLSRCDPVNPSTTTFGNINLTETMTNLIVAWKFNQNDWKKLYLHPKAFKIISNQIHIWCHSPVVARWIHQSLLFSISTIQKQLKTYLLFRKSLKNACNNLYFRPYSFNKT